MFSLIVISLLNPSSSLVCKVSATWGSVRGARKWNSKKKRAITRACFVYILFGSVWASQIVDLRKGILDEVRLYVTK